MWDKDAVAAVEAAGLSIATGKELKTLNGCIFAIRSHATAAPLYSNQLGTGTIFRGQQDSVTRFEIDKDGNIPLVGTVDGVDISGLKPLIVGCHEFVPQQDTYDFLRTDYYLQNGTVLTLQYFYAPIWLPHGATVNKLTLYGYRDDELAILRLDLVRSTRAGVSEQMAQVLADWTTGLSSGYDDTIDYPVIDNDSYFYHLTVRLDPNDAVNDVCFEAGRIDWS